MSSSTSEAPRGPRAAHLGGESACASVSLDADDLWSYLKTAGDPAWERRPSYLPTFYPLVLDLLDALELKITFFMVGFDVAREEHQPLVAEVAARGHEIGNHSYEHEPWLHRYSPAQLEEELARTEAAIATAAGVRPIGFRGPGYSWSPTLLRLLADRGYVYDASSLPTYIGPLARAYYLAAAPSNVRHSPERARLFGTFQDGRRPLTPYRWELGEGRSLLEIPVTTLPVVKVPFHLSYLLYISRYSERLAIGYLHTALAACRLAGVEPSFLLHPLDLLGGDEVRQLAFFPGMELSGQRKRAFFLRVLRALAERYTLVDMRSHAERVLAGAPRRRTSAATRPLAARVAAAE